MSKSLVTVYMGGRGSGKTLSMSFQCALDMMAGKNVWSNYPIKFRYKDFNGDIKTAESNLIDMPDLLNIQRIDKIRHGRVALDEWNLWLNSRRSIAVSNLIFSGVVQLIRKRDLSFDITTQDIRTLDRNIRWQTDVTVECFDLSFKYSQLREGEMIAQTLTDWSGVMTGRPLVDVKDIFSRQRNTAKQILTHGGKFWHIYKTDDEFDVNEIMSTKYRFENKYMTVGGLEGDFVTHEQSKQEMINEYKNMLLKSGTEKISTKDIKTAVIDMGVGKNINGVVGKMLNAAGFRLHRSPKGDYYKIYEATMA